MEPFILHNESYLTIDSWMNQFPGLVAGFTTKNGGVSTGSYRSLNLGFHVGDDVSDVRTNRSVLADHLEFPLENWTGAEQVHGNVIKKVTTLDSGKGAADYEDSIKGTDGLYSSESGVLMTLCFADCVPLFFVDPVSKMIGTAHAGWKGTVGQIAKEMVQNWEREGINPDQIHVAIGPSICEKCYIVDNRVINLVENILDDVDRKPYNLISAGQYSLDLQELNRLVLIKAGVPDRNILVTHFCSSCNDELFFSHRRDHGKTGRMLSFIGWKENR